MGLLSNCPRIVENAATMAKGFFTQSAVILFEGRVDVDAVARSLVDFDVTQRLDASDDDWMRGPTITIAMRPEVNGHVVVDLQDRTWPDQMGDPKTDSALFGAWATGWFGPFVFPQNLERAVAMSFTWSEAAAVTGRHTSFVRIKSSYVLGASGEATVLPADYVPLEELEFVTSVARAVARMPGALAYFNPNGEVLRTPQGLDENIQWHRSHGLPPLPAWANIRLFKHSPTWLMMDTIGMDQLDVDDHEACFAKGSYSPQEVDHFLRNATNYVLQNGPLIKDGDTMDGPGGIRWQAMSIEESLAPRPRRVLRWLPMDRSRVPQTLLK